MMSSALDLLDETGRNQANVNAVFPAIAPASYQPHALHASSRRWPETNCYVDLWIEVLATFAVPPESMLGFTLTQDFEGDQLTFFKVPLEDLETLYGIVTTELAIFDSVERHLQVQVERGRLCLVEVDSWFLPDTRGVSYQLEHGKTTIAINRIDPAGLRLEYFHNAGYFELSGQDYAGIFGHGQPTDGLPFLPYTEFSRFTAPAPSVDALRRRALDLLARHRARRPRHNPLAGFAEVFPGQVEEVAERSFDFFHKYAFNTLRQAGANFELLTSHLAWLDQSRFADQIAAASRIAETTKTAQFLLARAVSRRRFGALEHALDPAVEAWDDLMTGLDATLD